MATGNLNDKADIIQTSKINAKLLDGILQVCVYFSTALKYIFTAYTVYNKKKDI